mmetsp:Transcript_4732/g.14127  ORF Transcript_4732/g.14127 Transcript_4732/m.14127 type:complete len:228 (+) Transcript_4732:429-1112(+)
MPPCPLARSSPRPLKASRSTRGQRASPTLRTSRRRCPPPHGSRSCARPRRCSISLRRCETASRSRAPTPLRVAWLPPRPSQRRSDQTTRAAWRRRSHSAPVAGSRSETRAVTQRASTLDGCSAWHAPRCAARNWRVFGVGKRPSCSTPTQSPTGASAPRCSRSSRRRSRSCTPPNGRTASPWRSWRSVPSTPNAARRPGRRRSRRAGGGAMRRSRPAPRLASFLRPT